MGVLATIQHHKKYLNFITFASTMIGFKVLLAIALIAGAMAAEDVAEKKDLETAASGYGGYGHGHGGYGHGHGGYGHGHSSYGHGHGGYGHGHGGYKHGHGYGHSSGYGHGHGGYGHGGYGHGR